MRTIRGLKVVQVSGDAQSGVSKVFITFARGLRPSAGEMRRPLTSDAHGFSRSSLMQRRMAEPAAGVSGRSTTQCDPLR